MKRVQMFTGISGGRGDGTDWPPPGGFIDLDDEEARAIVAGGLGRYAPEEERRPAESDAETETATAASKPPGPAPKAVWANYAVSQGMSREEAVAATKAELQERYGKA